MERISLALWAYDAGDQPADLDVLAARIDRRMAEAAAAGASILVLPEWNVEQTLLWGGTSLKPNDEPRFMAETGAGLLERVRDLPARHGVALVAGTWSGPAAAGAGFVNRAYMVFPDGTLLTHDKLCLVPSEKDPNDWALATGSTVRVATWRGLRIAMLICLDVELPALSTILSGLDIDLLLVPSNTAKRSGYHRVFGCAKARAIELGTLVGVVGCVGTVLLPEPRTNFSGAAVYGPCEAMFGDTGIFAFLEPRDAGGDVLIARDLPVGEIRRRRREGFEVWPGPWPAGHVKVEEVTIGDRA
ncbi:MAG TPA: nitrilase-related carbon-nitrogen hydrolase [Geminicoccus sp.]|uniref:nitrilase-related carbon-nitrogen hydrolase n=1 Tax=Geminicoccus sp. TaxID=2024832 RepID=UPI002E32B82F|nr:nitrilase-related carbon-nitrogen hydrolase [Geminicoccus sp.]HEX2527845.1 nitrilase-related carbon-nitrogen hydrolase [Geminicoccus sp.]